MGSGTGGARLCAIQGRVGHLRDGPHPACERGRECPDGGQLAPAAGKYWKAGRGADARSRP